MSVLTEALQHWASSPRPTFGHNPMKTMHQIITAINSSDSTDKQNVVENIKGLIHLLLCRIHSAELEINSIRARKICSKFSLWYWKQYIEDLPFRMLLRNWGKVKWTERRISSLFFFKTEALRTLGVLSLALECQDFSLLLDEHLLGLDQDDILGPFPSHLLLPEGKASLLETIQSHWLDAALIGGSLFLGHRLYKRFDLEQTIICIADVGLALQNIFTDWILEPIRDIWQIVRYSKSNIEITDQLSVEADVQALHRMIQQYKEDRFNQIDMSHIDHSDEFALILKDYESNIKAPIRNALVGDLIRLLLIQVQKSKVDLGLAMLSIDRLLKANELNFEMLAVIPLVVVLLYGLSKSKEAWKTIKNGPRHQLGKQFNWTLREIEACLPTMNSKLEIGYGELIFFIFQLTTLWTKLDDNHSWQKMEAFYQDISQLLSAELPTEAKHWVVLRMRNLYDLHI